MATKRDIKKDISYLCEYIVLDALQVSEITDESNKPEVVEIIAGISSLYKDLISRVNHPDGKDNPKLVKAHYKSITHDLLTECDKFYNQLNKLIPAE
ncbi:MAG TPA: hypothetical protein PKH79_09130 [Prolixibacteraceae bacterium]|nr:hypothetical protein [Prolixibacteraceae bacterium]HPS13735.1 hypothetical protein [Prolixibacteraceae bacterium]